MLKVHRMPSIKNDGSLASVTLVDSGLQVDIKSTGEPQATFLLPFDSCRILLEGLEDRDALRGDRLAVVRGEELIRSGAAYEKILRHGLFVVRQGERKSRIGVLLDDSSAGRLVELAREACLMAEGYMSTSPVFGL